MMHEQAFTDQAQADEWLEAWYNWTSGYRPQLGAPRCDPACRESKSSRQWDSTSDITRETADRLDLEAVEYCYDALPFPYQNAIGIEMKNRQAKVRVWRSPMGKTYSEAVLLIIPIMRRKNLLR